MRWQSAVSPGARSPLKSRGISVACGRGPQPARAATDQSLCWASRVLTVALLASMAGCGGGSSQSMSPPESVERINGIVVPPLPDATANQATVGGVDVNGNGIRDDIDRLIAQNFGTEPQLLTLATEHAQRLQAVISTPSSAANTAYANQFRCLRDRRVLDRLSLQTRATLDTTARKKAYGLALAGLAVSLEGC